jgi:DNA topoisomerase I
MHTFSNILTLTHTFSFSRATFYAAMDPDGMHLGNPKTSKIFTKNFFADFKTTLDKKHVIRDFDKCDFGPIRRHLNEQKMVRNATTDDQKKANKEDRNQFLFKYGYSIVDGHLEKVGNYNMEPPGAFRGRGEHPKMGKLKSRVNPEQVALNLSECAPVPRCPVPGHAWGDLRHDPQVQWLAQWKENINNQVKYMQLAAQSSFKGKSDRSKYSKAAVLCEKVIHVRAATRKSLKSKDVEERQLATAVWVIDRLALRVGGEKDTDEEADTVGCCSLRVEHMQFDPNDEGGDNKEIELKFLGKDSMLYQQTIDFGAALYNDNNGMGKQVYDNFKGFCKGKKKSEEIFDKINPSMLNVHLKQFMDGLTAKVFRTYNASKTLQDELSKTEAMKSWRSLTASEKVVEYNNANREVAILCNHQRSVSKAQENQLDVIGKKLDMLKKQKKQLKIILKSINSGDSTKIPIKKSEEEMVEKVNKAVAKAKEMKEKAKTTEQKIKATEQDLKAKQMKRDLNDQKFNQAHLWEKTPTADQVAKKLQNWTAKITKMEMDLKHKDDNKEVSLGTSKINYMDPRISVAWCKRNEVPIEKIFSKTLRDKFNWAMAVPPDWEFNAKIGKQA